MTAIKDPTYREWSRYDWASEEPPTDEVDVPRWNLVDWVGETADGKRVRPIDAASMAEGDEGFSGRRHNPGGGNRWAEGYRH